MRKNCFLFVSCLLFALSASAATVFVDAENTSGTEDGTTWATAFTKIQDGIDAAAGAGGEVWVAEGVYNEVRLSDASGALVMAPNVHLYGGFIGLGPGGEEDAREQRDWTAHLTVIDGANGRGAGARAYHVVIGADNATLDGFRVTGGDANSGVDFPLNYGGGGMANLSVSPLVSNCVFTGNHAAAGGGMINAYSAAPTVVDCTFYDNHAHNYPALPPPDTYGIGGGVANVYTSSPKLLNCTFDSNTAENFGGGVYNFSGSTPTIDGCLFTANQSIMFGGGLFGYQNVSSSVKNCRFLDNTSNTGGAIDHEGTSSIVMSNCVFAGNVGTTRCSGLSLFSSTATVTNCTFNDDPSGDASRIRVSGSSASLTMENSIVWSTSATPILLVSSGTATVSYSNVYGGYTGAGNIGGDTVADDPDFVNAPAQDLRLASGSPCIDTANPAGVPPAPDADVRGVPRPQDGLVDMGAYEYDDSLPVFSDIAPAPALAKIGTVVTVTFTVSEPLAGNPAVTVNGHPAAYASKSDLDYSYTYTVDTSDPEGNATIEVSGADFAGNANSLSDSSGLTIDKTAPEFSNIAPTPALAKVGTVVTITFTVSESLIANPTVTVNGHAAAYASNSGLDYTYTYTVDVSDPEGNATIEVVGSDLAGNANSLSDSSGLTVDKTAPEFSDLVVTPSEARPEETVRISFTSSESLLEDPEVTINGIPAIPDGSKDDYNFNYLVSELDSEGPAVIEIQGQDLAGNTGVLSNSIALTIAPRLPVHAWPAVVALVVAGAYIVARRHRARRET